MSVMYITSSGQRSRVFPTAVDHRRLTKTDSASEHFFLHAYDWYARKVTERSWQVTGLYIISAEVSKPMRMKYYVDAECLESVMD